MILQYYSSRKYIGILSFLLLIPSLIFSNHKIIKNDDVVILSYNEKKTDKLCGKSHFYMTDVNIELDSEGYLSVSLTQFSKTNEGFITHMAIEMLDGKGRVLTTYETPTLVLESGEKNKISKQHYFTENLQHQFIPEEFKIFIEAVKEMRVVYKGCNQPNTTAEVDLLKRKLPREIVEEFIHQTPLVSD
ncbi:hypothetical protein [Abyssalbus ytuae]|uniref:Uncharacterized protein n=1 Tax=Abyssalbus ytuae TaxID=2926907 RepID=A0A9E6ZK87_9FLAO|nr:hypothetical protein [Abyssalbus ytuae]UOB17207.1 hypothetical protein MQE35_15900 [Abyssalbus ytuae]